MIVIPAWLVVQAAEILGWLGIYQTYSRGKTREILLHGKRQPKRIPIVDKRLARYAGNATRTQRWVAKRTAVLIRNLVNTQAYELALLIILNRKSKLYKQEKPLCLPRQIHR